jgi:hypothetical protein
MDYTINFTWQTRPHTASVVPGIYEEQSSLCAFFKDEELINEFGPFLNIFIENDDLEEPVSDLEKIKKIILVSAQDLPAVQKASLKKLMPGELLEKLRQLENDYAKRFTGLNNHKMLSELWERIKLIKEEIAKRGSVII